MNVNKKAVAAVLVVLGIAGVAAGAIHFAPGYFARQFLKQANVEFTGREFIDAACREDTGTILLMLSAGMDVNVKAPDERRSNAQTTALYCAASKGNTKLIGLLIDHGASTELAGPANETPIFAAASAPPRNFQAPTFEAVTALLERGAQVNAKSDNGTVLHAACRTGNMKLVNFLLDHGANPSITDARGAPPVTMCATYSYGMYGGAEIPFDRLLVKGVDINAVGQEGTTLLGRAVQSGNVKLVEKLLAVGANPNAVDGNGDPPLASAVRSLEMMGLLLDKGADINLQGKNGTPLMAAIRFQLLPAVGFLLSRGADPKLADKQGNTPLHYAAQSPIMAPVIKMLVARGASPNAANLEGNTPLHLAARGRVTATVEELLAAGARPNEKNLSGQTPLALEKTGGGVPYPIVPGMPIPMQVQVAGRAVPAPSAGANTEVEKILVKHGAKP